MSAIEVQAPGLLTTVQDLGRPGFGPMGVSPSGAADAISLRLGNLLIGNPSDAPALEMTLLGGTFFFPGGGIAALAGAEFGATLESASIQPWTSFEIGCGQTLRVGPTQSGARCYLCVRGGIAAKPFLGGASTHLLSGLGGFEGRPLKKGDILPIGPEPARPFRKRMVARKALAQLTPCKVLRVTPGPQSGWFPETSQRLFHEANYRVAEESNRMGLRLEGAALTAGSQRQMISEGVPLGAVQVPTSGQPIILFVEQQTTGGYPKIANVISADLHSVGQLRPRDEIRFERCTMEEARSLLQEQENLLSSPELILE